MNKLYWKMFISFWCVTMVTFFAAVWLTTEVMKESFISNPEKRQISVDASAAVMFYDLGGWPALSKWIKHLSEVREGQIYLFTSQGKSVLSTTLLPDAALVAKAISESRLPASPLRKDTAMVSEPIVSATGRAYRLVEVTKLPIFIFFTTHAQDLLLRVIFSAIVSGFLCYLISRYLTKPLQKISRAAKQLGEGKLSTRVDPSVIDRGDEMADLGSEFDRMAEHLEDLISSQQRLLWGVSHELRSPLARMQIALGLAQKKANGIADCELARIEVESERLNELIGNLLSLAKLESRAETLEKKPLSMTELVKGVVADANFEAKSKSPRVLFSTSKSFIVEGSELLLHSAVENIVRNALRYSDEEHKVEVSVDDTASPRRGILITVSDRGPGVSDEKLDKLFDPFYRADECRTPGSGGYGLGLAIAKKAIALHEGRIQATNRTGGGLTVSLFVPYSKAA